MAYCGEYVVGDKRPVEYGGDPREEAKRRYRRSVSFWWRVFHWFDGSRESEVRRFEPYASASGWVYPPPGGWPQQ